MILRTVLYFDIDDFDIKSYENEIGRELKTAEDIKRCFGIYDYFNLCMDVNIANVSFVSDNCDIDKCEEYEANLI